MSLIVTVFVREGIVMAADSRLTLDANTQQGNQQVVKLAVGLKDSVRKCFLAPGAVGIATYGAADIGGVPITGYIESFIAERLSGNGHLVDAVPALLLDYFRQLPGPPATQFHVAGYKAEGARALSTCGTSTSPQALPRESMTLHNRVLPGAAKQTCCPGS
jgi:hypothetical protein